MITLDPTLMNQGYYVKYWITAIYQFDKPEKPSLVPITTSKAYIYFNNGLYYDTE